MECRKMAKRRGTILKLLVAMKPFARDGPSRRARAFGSTLEGFDWINTASYLPGGPRPRVVTWIEVRRLRRSIPSHHDRGA